MEMLFEVVKNGLNLRPTFEQPALPLGHDLALLFVMRRHNEDCAPEFVQLLVQGAAVSSVANCHLNEFIQ